MQPDSNAPERPPSAYVIFSNRKCFCIQHVLDNTHHSVEVREDIKGQDLSFTEIAKIVGERWQILQSEVRETYEQQANASKEKYYAELAEYKKTPEYVQYQDYLIDFRAKHGPLRAGETQVPVHFDALY